MREERFLPSRLLNWQKWRMSGEIILAKTISLLLTWVAHIISLWLIINTLRSQMFKERLKNALLPRSNPRKKLQQRSEVVSWVIWEKAVKVCCLLTPWLLNGRITIQMTSWLASLTMLGLQTKQTIRASSQKRKILTSTRIQDISQSIKIGILLFCTTWGASTLTMKLSKVTWMKLWELKRLTRFILTKLKIECIKSRIFWLK